MDIEPGSGHGAAAGFRRALSAEEGQEILRGSAAADLPGLSRWFQAQEKRSWCGVATAVIVLAALRGDGMAQEELFTREASAVRSWWAVTFGGMSLVELAGLLAAHGVVAESHHADEGVAAFRAAVVANAGRAEDFLIVNWQRSALGQEGEGGHLSPIAAYDPVGDRVLVLDVAAHRYPWAWFPVVRLFAAMDTRDGEALRGWLVVRRGGDGAAGGG